MIKFKTGDRVEFNLFGSKHVRGGTVRKVTRTYVYVAIDGWEPPGRTTFHFRPENLRAEEKPTDQHISVDTVNNNP